MPKLEGQTGDNMTTHNADTLGCSLISVEAWKRALIAATDAAQTAAGLLVVVTLAEQLRPWLEAELRPVE
jgi:hypothetical protein